MASASRPSSSDASRSCARSEFTRGLPPLAALAAAPERGDSLPTGASGLSAAAVPPATCGLDGAHAPGHRGCTHATPAPTTHLHAIHTPPSLAHPLSRSHSMTHARRACARARARTHTSISGPLRITLRSAQRESAHLPAYEYTGRAPRAEPGVQGSVRSAWQCTPQSQACKVYRLEGDALFFAPQIFQIWRASVGCLSREDA